MMAGDAAPTSRSRDREDERELGLLRRSCIIFSRLQERVGGG